MGAVTRPIDLDYHWDGANNLLRVTSSVPVAQFPDHIVPRQQRIEHDALYRVTGVEFRYNVAGVWTGPPPPSQDWRAEQTSRVDADPMAREPAPMLPAAVGTRVDRLDYAYDWLANMTSWTDDVGSFYERSLGSITNGSDLNGSGGNVGEDGEARPAALYFAHNLDSSAPANQRGYVQLTYGASGNVATMTVHAQCTDDTASGGSCSVALDPETPGELATLVGELADDCSCAREQHYQYRWDELNRLAEARRYDRSNTGNPHPPWELQVRQRYRYDAGNVRTVKETLQVTPDAAAPGQSGERRAALYVLPGDFERRGVQQSGGAWVAAENLSGESLAEAQYLVGGARVVVKAPLAGGPLSLDSNVRVTVALPDLLQSTSAVVDLLSRELLEVGTFYPNGAREALWVNDDPGVASGMAGYSLESVGFTGKEGDDEVGLTYFGERYLMGHLGRWASADPLEVHQASAGEFGNSYHYISGNSLQAIDPNGLEMRSTGETNADGDTIWEADLQTANGETVNLGTCEGSRLYCGYMFADQAFSSGLGSAVYDLLRPLIMMLDQQGRDELRDSIHQFMMFPERVIPQAAADAIRGFLTNLDIALSGFNLNAAYAAGRAIVDLAGVASAVRSLAAPVITRFRARRAARRGVAPPPDPPRLFENRFPDHEVSPPAQTYSGSQVTAPRFSRRFNYVVLEDGTLVMGRIRNNARNQGGGGGHIDLAQGRPVRAAGEGLVVDCQLRRLNNASGHYQPFGPHARAAALEAFRELGFDVVGVYDEIFSHYVYR